MGWGAGIFFIFLSREAPPIKNTIFIKVRETAPVCREHVHTGGPDTRIDNSIFKKSNVMSFQ